MAIFEIDFEYRIKEYGSITDIHADSAITAEDTAYPIIKNLYPDIEDIEITGVREIV